MTVLAPFPQLAIAPEVAAAMPSTLGAEFLAALQAIETAAPADGDKVNVAEEDASFVAAGPGSGPDAAKPGPRASKERERAVDDAPAPPLWTASVPLPLAPPAVIDVATVVTMVSEPAPELGTATASQAVTLPATEVVRRVATSAPREVPDDVAEAEVSVPSPSDEQRRPPDPDTLAPAATARRAEGQKNVDTPPQPAIESPGISVRVRSAASTVLPRETRFVKLLANCERPPVTAVSIAPDARELAPAPALRAVVPEMRASVEAPPVTPVAAPEPTRDVAPPARMQLAFGARLSPASEGNLVKPVRGGAATDSQSNTKQDQAPAARAASPGRPVEEPKTRELRPGVEPGDPRTAEGGDTPSMPSPRDAVGGTPERAGEKAESPDVEVERPRAVAATTLPQKTPAAPAREIRIEVAGPDSKVEVRLVERAGGVHLGVRTTDDGLAGKMREHLPILSSRLEENGFRADQWHAAEASGPARRLEVAASSESSGQAQDQGHGGGREPRDRDERRPTPREERNERQKKGSSFEWLMQSLR